MKAQLVLIRTNNLSAKVIHLGMWVYCKLRGLPVTKTYNHCEILTGDYTTGAIAEGVVRRDFDAYLFSLRQKGIYEDHKMIDIEVTDLAYDNGLKYLKEMQGRKYEYTMFISHAFFILFDFWLGYKKNKRLSCYELLIGYVNSLGKYEKLDVTLNPYQVSNIFTKLGLY